jgi:hypothetical protein
MHGSLGLVDFDDLLDAFDVLKVLAPAVARTPGAPLRRRYDVEGNARVPLSVRQPLTGRASRRLSMAVVRAEMMAPWSGDGAACATITPSTSSYRQASPNSC